MATNRPSSAATAGADSITRVILGSSTGTLIEWYDFYIFGSLAAVLVRQVLPARQ